MKLYYSEKGKDKPQILEVDFWSFMKCNLLANLALTGIVYGTMFVFFIFLLILGMLFTGGI